MRYIGDEAFGYNEIAIEPDLSRVPHLGENVFTKTNDIAGTFYQYDHESRVVRKYDFNKDPRTIHQTQRSISENGEWDGNWVEPDIVLPISYSIDKNKLIMVTRDSGTYDVKDYPIEDSHNIGDEFYELNEEPTLENGILYMDTMSRGVAIAFTKVIVKNVIPTEFKTKKVETILRYGIKYTEFNITDLIIPKSIKFIGEHGLGTNRIKSVSFEEGSELETLHNYALADTYALSLVIPNKVKHIRVGALNNNNRLTNVTFAPDSIIESIDEGAFGTGVTSITFPKSLKNFAGAIKMNIVKTINIEEGSPYFKVENNLVLSMDGKELWHGNDEESSERVIPEGIEIIHKEAFYGDKKSGVSLPSTLRIIEKDAFKDNSFTSVTIPASVTYIGETAFYDSVPYGSKINSLIFEQNSLLEYIGKNAFANSVISTVTLPKHLKTIDRAFNFSKMDTINLEDGSEYFKIENNIVLSMDGRDVWFGNPTEETRIVIPEGVEIIHIEAFFGAQKTDLYLPSTLAKIELNAFYDHRFTYVYFSEAIEVIERGAFFNFSSVSTLASITFAVNSPTTIIGYTAFATAYKANPEQRPDLSWAYWTDGQSPARPYSTT
jgi:hypothetical protein